MSTSTKSATGSVCGAPAMCNVWLEVREDAKAELHDILPPCLASSEGWWWNRSTGWPARCTAEYGMTGAPGEPSESRS